MTTPLVLDIETLPLKSAMTAEYPAGDFSPPANYKNPDAIAEWHRKNEERWRGNREKECSLNPRLGRVLCFGSKQVGAADVATIYAQEEKDEADVLREMWKRITDSGSRVVTWHGEFDLRFLLIRSMANRVLPLASAADVRSWFKRYDVFNHFDVKAVLSNWDRKFSEGLDEWAEFFGLPGKPEGLDGSQVAWLYHENQHDTIRKYCADDVANTEAMYLRLVPYFGGDR